VNTDPRHTPLGSVPKRTLSEIQLAQAPSEIVDIKCAVLAGYGTSGRYHVGSACGHKSRGYVRRAVI
jgi:hypothetical protein